MAINVMQPLNPKNFVGGLTILLILVIAPSLRALQIQDIVHLKGSEVSHLVGMGLVVGLNGTGDGKFSATMRSLAQTINRLNNPNVVAAELKDAKNVSLVALRAKLPGHGVREGDLVDVYVSSIGTSKSLEGGELIVAPLAVPPNYEQVYAFAGGKLTIEDEELPRTAVIGDGAQLTADVRSQLMDPYGLITLIIKRQNASWPVANNLANLINELAAENVPDIARAADQKNVVVQLPIWERENPAAFISAILESYIDPALVSNGAKVVINERTGTIVIGGDVQISPVLISHKGLTITKITPETEPTPAEPKVIEKHFISLDPEQRSDQKAHDPTLSDLEAAFNQLKVDARDRIEIIKAMHESGDLHGQLILQQ